MSNPSTNNLINLPLDELKKILSQEKQKVRKDYREMEEKRKIIKQIKKVRKVGNKIRQGKVIRKKTKNNLRGVQGEYPPPKTFEEYFEECIKNRKIPKDTPPYLRKALERAMREYQQGIQIEKSSLDGFAQKYIIKGIPGETPNQFFINNIDKIKEFLKNHKNIKVRFILEVIMAKWEKNYKGKFEITDHSYFHSETYSNMESTNVKNIIGESKEKILEGISNYQQNGSDWYFKQIHQLEIHTNEFRPIRGSSYIPLPDWIMRKKAIVNIQNKDDKCFLWSVLRYLHPREKNDTRLGDLKQYEFSLNTKGITFPMKVKDINKFERLNPDLPKINVFSIDDKTIYPLREISIQGGEFSTNRGGCRGRIPHSIDLFFYEEDGKSHYSLIKNFSRLIRSQITTRTNEPIQICKRCFSHFTTPELLEKHIQYCYNNCTAFVKMPKPGSNLYFKNYYKQLPIPFTVYADFECITSTMSTCCPNPKDSYNYNYQKHEPSGFCFYVKGISGKRIKPIIYTKSSESDNVAKIFVEKIIELTKGIYEDFYRKPIKMVMTPETQKEFNNAVNCHICGYVLGKDRVRDHCHFTGKYRGAAHNKCNLMCRKPRILPVIFHNLQGYDSHLFIKELAKIDGKLDCIPSTEEKYISFSKHIKVGEYKHINGDIYPVTFEIRFLDSYKFLQSSLGNLVLNLSEEDFHNTRSEFKSNIELLTRKGVYPYDYISSLDKLSETCLPPKEEFYSKLNDTNISDEDYQHAIKVWNKFECCTLRDYHDLYLKSDVLLLADVFEKFRSTCLKHYQLDPAHYYTAPGLAWDACLKLTGKNLELLTDYDMLMMFERGIRGGITHISKRYSEANNKYMKKYNPSKKSKFIQYLDANNLYGWAMSQNLPTHGFKWIKDLSVEKVHKLLLGGCRGRIPRGYIFEVDLEYPEDLWDQHNDYPLAPELMKVNGVEKLICHFKSRKNYVIHYKTLKQCLELGMKISAVHGGISFCQSPWMEPYIRKNTELRKCATNSFEKDFFKLMNNSVFGKTIENIRKRQNVRLVDNRKTAIKLSNKPNFDRCTIFDKNLIAIHMKKTEVYFNKPVYIGQAILDLSKTLMFDFHYNYIKNKYGKKAQLLFTDTDSLAYEIRTKDFYADIKDDVIPRFDTSDYPSNHPSGILTGVNKKVIGKFKDEAAGKQITHFVGLRPKLYSYKIEEKEVKKCKGIKSNVVKKTIDFDLYVKCLFSDKKEMRKMKIIKSEKHDIYSKEVNKVALSNQDDKRLILKDKIHTLALR